MDSRILLSDGHGWTCNGFARNHRLLLSNAQVQQQQQHQHCLFGTPGLQRSAREAQKVMPGKVYQGFCCTKCKNFRSAKNVAQLDQMTHVPFSHQLAATVNREPRYPYELRSPLRIAVQRISHFYRQRPLSEDNCRLRATTLSSTGGITFARYVYVSYICICSGYMLFC